MKLKTIVSILKYVSFDFNIFNRNKPRTIIINEKILAKKLYNIEKELTSLEFIIKFDSKITIKCKGFEIKNVYETDNFFKEFENV